MGFMLAQVWLSIGVTELAAKQPAPQDWSTVDGVLQSFVHNGTFPGATYVVGISEGILHSHSVGRYTYDPAATLMSPETLFDVASLTKVTVTTTCAMLLYQWGVLHLDARLVEFYGAGFAATDDRKRAMTVRHLLLHEAGWPPDPTPSYCTPQFACPETALPPQRRRTTFSCQARIVAALSAQRLDTMPGARYVYSDLSMISLMLVLGRLARPYVLSDALRPACVAAASTSTSGAIDGLDQCYYEAFARAHVLSPLANSSGGGFMGFLPPEPLWPQAAPTWNDTDGGFPGECVVPYRQRVLQGEVSDGNAYALGGIAGHAGLFANALQLHALLHQLLFAPVDARQPSRHAALGINATTARLFTRVANASFSSRALGWDTNAPGGYLGCGSLSPSTFTHTGYTGTLLCADPERALTTVLLTNRVYPRADERSSHGVHLARQAFNDAVLRVLRNRKAATVE